MGSVIQKFYGITGKAIAGLLWAPCSNDRRWNLWVAVAAELQARINPSDPIRAPNVPETDVIRRTGVEAGLIVAPAIA
jgi:hypothetical protein